jgi:uncharacterized membrane protein YgcG
MQKELWANILNFDFDFPVSEYGFTTRLANENYWTKNFTINAIAEYKKFMYLATTSNFMVSPSAIVDIVWHQHLIFTQSYTEFCNLLGKQIQHVPSTHNRNEFEKFKQAKERTTKLYKEVFGEQPKEIWEYSDMYDSLELPKAKFKIRSFIVIGIIAFAVLLVPFYYLLKPIYVQLDNPYFVYGFIAISIFTFCCLEIFNRSYLAKTMDRFNNFSFIKNLHPSELIFLKTEKLSSVIHGTMNQLFNKNVIEINSDFSINHTLHLEVNSVEEHQILDTLHNLGNTKYQILIQQLLRKPIFGNVANSMIALKKYFLKSKTFGKLFYTNFVILALLLMLGTIRLTSGIFREKAVTNITVILITITAVSIAYLWYITNIFCNKTIPNCYKNTILPESSIVNDFESQYFLLGNAALSAAFIPLLNHVDRGRIGDRDLGGSSCGSSCGGGCGGGGGGCGGGCGGCGG